MSKNNIKADSAALKDVQILGWQDLGASVPEKRASSQEYAIWVRSLLQNWRQGTVGCKGRSDVSRSNKKPWKQKGTGRARAGSARSPLWRGGGVTFGPQARSKKLSVNKAHKKRVFSTLVADFLEHSKIVTVDWTPDKKKPSTSQAFNMLKQSGLGDKKIVIFVAKDDGITYQSFSNIPNVRLSYFDQPNAFTVSGAEYLLVLNKDLGELKQMVSRWS